MGILNVGEFMGVGYYEGERQATTVTTVTAHTTADDPTTAE